MQIKRSKEDLIKQDLKLKMVLLCGPRQVGKTFLAREIMHCYKSPIYLNFDSIPHKKIIKDQTWSPLSDLIVFDEIHKMPDWKNYLKGIFDTRPSNADSELKI